MSASATTRVDMHVKLLDERVVERAKANDIDVLVYAPHFARLPAIRATAERFSDDELLVVPGREVFTGSWRDRRHLLAVGLAEPVPDFITLEGAMAEFERQGAAVLVPHPTLLNVSMNEEDVASYAGRLHAVETYNAKCPPTYNRRGQRLAGDVGLPGFGSSYAHLRGTVGEAWTRFGVPVESESDLVEALAEGAPRRVVHRGGLGHRLRSLAELSHLGYENTWGKIDRLFLSGMEPTHPNHLAYGGRFDDVCVY
ncbi:PHP-associated domain-containing protein [Halegenticoccus tardaugens]|uniref:PHP-associated domain-containing protein n=1 Tax=Halegenticoccus tardaugens TaxID=2071624 RepID=UPI001E50D725|nr:PHP-associated domain-containing protein [Halegenticoccus tardaugens]